MQRAAQRSALPQSRTGRGCIGAFVLVIGVPHLLAGLTVVLGAGTPMGAIFIGSGTICCLIAGRMFGAGWRATLGVLLCVLIAAMAVGLSVAPPPNK